MMIWILKCHQHLQIFSHKMGCVFLMVDVSLLPHAEFGRNDYREDAPHFSFYRQHKSPTWSRAPTSFVSYMTPLYFVLSNLLIGNVTDTVQVCLRILFVRIRKWKTGFSNSLMGSWLFMLVPRENDNHLSKQIINELQTNQPLPLWYHHAA